MQISRARVCVLLNMYTFFQKLCKYVHLFHKLCGYVHLFHKMMPNLANFPPHLFQIIPYLSPTYSLSIPYQFPVFSLYLIRY